MTNCTGKRCPVQVGKIDPAICEAYKYCQWATRPMTNADRIRAMTDEELAEYLILDIECEVARRVGRPISNEEINHVLRGTLNWLKQEVEDG